MMSFYMMMSECVFSPVSHFIENSNHLENFISKNYLMRYMKIDILINLGTIIYVVCVCDECNYTTYEDMSFILYGPCEEVPIDKIEDDYIDRYNHPELYMRKCECSDDRYYIYDIYREEYYCTENPNSCCSLLIMFDKIILIGQKVFDIIDAKFEDEDDITEFIKFIKYIRTNVQDDSKLCSPEIVKLLYKKYREFQQIKEQYEKSQDSKNE